MMSLRGNSSQTAPSSEAVARYVDRDIGLNAAQPAAEWAAAAPLVFCADWQGGHPDRGRETRVRLLWNTANLFLRFECRYRELFLFHDSESSGRRDHLWDRDVVEAFLQPEPSRPRFYKELEVSPNGMWIDLDISPAGLADLKSGMQRSVILDEKQGIWSAEVAIPMAALTPHFDPTVAWRVNFYRIEGTREPRAYMAWRPTHTPKPNFHVPGAFGILRFNK